MGGGYWRKEDFERYSAGMGRKVGADGHKVMRECCDSDEHPDTLPVILALDVTGSMGGALLKTAASLNVIMQKILDEYEDVEFMVMGIGDLSYDRAPIQISQFESDIRIAEHLDRLWFERGGGGNGFESYTAAWYMGLYHTRLDCWEKGRKGILITIGDEPLNPYLPADRLAQITGDQVVRDVNTYALYRAVLEKYEIFHIAIDDKGKGHSAQLRKASPRQIYRIHIEFAAGHDPGMPGNGPGGRRGNRCKTPHEPREVSAHIQLVTLPAARSAQGGIYAEYQSDHRRLLWR